MLADIVAHVDSLLEASKSPPSIELQSRLYTATLAVMTQVYGPGSSQERDLRAFVERLREKTHPSYDYIIVQSLDAIRGALQAVRGDLKAGILDSVRALVTGEVLSDLLRLARIALDEPGDGAQSVAAVLVAAAFEDTLRRMATLKGLPDAEKLQDIITALKDASVLTRSQVGVAQSYLSFRNKALHARWTEIDRVSIQSCMAFTEQAILSHLAEGAT